MVTLILSQVIFFTKRLSFLMSEIMNEYLSILGISVWVPRLNSSKMLSYYKLLKKGQLRGYLIADQIMHDKNTLFGQLLKEMILSIGVEFYLIDEIVSANITKDLYLISLGEEAKEWVSQVPQIVEKIACPSIYAMLTNPSLKQEVWLKIKSIRDLN